MGENIQAYAMVFASAATGSVEVRLPSHDRLLLYVPNSVAWNAGTGNAVINLEGRAVSAVSLATVNGYSLTTDAQAPKVYDFGEGGMPLVRLALATATTANASATFYLIARQTT